MKAFLLSLLIVVSSAFTLKAWAGSFPSVQVRNAAATINEITPQLAKIKADAEAAREKVSAPFKEEYAEKQKLIDEAYATLKKHCFTLDEAGKVVPLFTCGVLPTPTTPTATPAPSTFDLDKLAKAVAIHETGNCTAKRGAALYKNCHGFRVSGKFLRFNSTDESYAKFKKLWMKDYQQFPNLRLATAYVCGWNHLKKSGTVPCDGGSPSSWLASVTKIYDTL